MNHSWTAEQLSPLALAFIGDAVWEVYARNHALNLGFRKPQELHRATKQYVQAAGQASLLEGLRPLLTEDELTLLKRGRNAKSGHVKRRVNVLEYRHSTGFEALVGYLFGSGQHERLEQLCHFGLQWIDDHGGAVHAEDK